MDSQRYLFLERRLAKIFISWAQETIMILRDFICLLRQAIPVMSEVDSNGFVFLLFLLMCVFGHTR